MLPEGLPFRVIRVNSEDEVLARAANLVIGRAAFETARRLFPKDVIHFRNGAQIIARSEPHFLHHRSATWKAKRLGSLPKLFPIALIDILAQVGQLALDPFRGCGRSVRRRGVSIDLFQRRAGECRRLAAAARNTGDKKFWLGLVERWHALESQNVWELGRRRPRSRLRRQQALLIDDLE